ncbi:HCL257Cp [Eremothecium sinecaudum]|uniref:HCL257Cp n=1 Tax=Eremothecium sinecaudum TaxID=45286 RepID=A0A0X8HR35_9SACH|nr:HCL257Cp [Eremothecium sinecaudum]AMD19894.1 HCL257Cp [Eremothecium sinecaudum]
MGSSRSSWDNNEQEYRPNLPQLPPLLTRNLSSNGHQTRTGWKPSTDEEVPLSQTSSQGPWSENGRFKRPIISPFSPENGVGTFQSLEHSSSVSCTSKDDSLKVDSINSTGESSRTRRKSMVKVYPTESDEELPIPTTPEGPQSSVFGLTSSTTPVIYNSPFVGDTSSEFMKAINHHHHTDSAGSFSTPVSADDTFEDLLPPQLPARSGAGFDWQLPSWKSSFEDVANISVLGTPPPLHPQHPNRLRKHSDNTITGSISSYYSNSNYAFNGYRRQGSFGSVSKGIPLEHAPNVIAPTQLFSIDLLDEKKLYQCYCVYKLSDIYEWLLKIYFEWFTEYIFDKIEFIQLVQLLLEFQLPTNYEQDVIDKNVDRIIASLVQQGAVRFESNLEPLAGEYTVIVSGLDIRGIFTEILPCYSYDHKRDMVTDQLYSCHCNSCPLQLANRKRRGIQLSDVINKSVGLWTDYWNLTEEDLADINPKEIMRQSFIFDLIILEERTLNMANAAIEIYGKRFYSDLLPDDKNIKALAFDIFHPLIELHKDFLLAPIFSKLESKGKFIDGVGRIYYKWCHEAVTPYLQYAESMATVHEVINWEKSHNTKFADWLKEVDESPEVTRTKLYHDVVFFGGFFKSLQNIPVTLRSILKVTDPSIDDYEHLEMAITEIEKLNALVDKTHGEAVDQRKLNRLSRQLIVGSSSTTVSYVNISSEGNEYSLAKEKLNLKLTEKTRKLLKEGVVFKKRELWLDPLPTYVILLDNYFLITEIVIKGYDKKYKLYERPIPIDYLSLETKNDFASPAKTSPDKESALNTDMQNMQLNMHPRSSSSSGKVATSNNGSNNLPMSKSLSKLPVINNSEAADDISYSFKVRNTATNESFSFLLPTAEERDAWKTAIVESVRRHTSSNDRQIFKLSFLTDLFCYDERQAPTNLHVAPEGSVIDLALKSHQSSEHSSDSLIMADVNCCCTFNTVSRSYVLCGSNRGLFVATSDKTTVWKLILTLPKITQLEINEKLNLLFVLSDRKLCYFSLPNIIGAFHDSTYLPQGKLAGILLRDKVTFFRVAEDFCNFRQIFYERKGKIVILTPELDKITSRFRFFKFYKEFKIPANNTALLSSEIEDIVIFKMSFMVCTSKGVILFNDSFNDEGIVLPSMLNDPEMMNPTINLSSNPFKSERATGSKKDSSKLRMAEYVRRDIISNKTKPITCFQLSQNDFILVFDEAVIRLNRNGEIPKWKEDILVLDFYCTSAAMNNEFLILIGENLIQIYDFNYTGNIVNNTLSNLAPVQIIKGKRIRLLSSKKDNNAVIVLSHPNIQGRQLILAFGLAS